MSPRLLVSAFGFGGGFFFSPASRMSTVTRTEGTVLP
jgi:hypothetical protein